MDNYYARAYVTERLQEAANKRLLAEMPTRKPKPSLLNRLRSSIGSGSPWWRPLTPAPVVASGECVDLDCCPA